MLKSLMKIMKQDKERIEIPRSIQQTIPIKRVWADGVWMVGNKYSKTWKFSDINYEIASKEDKTAMFLDYSELLNSLDSSATTKITICNRRINKAEFEESILIPLNNDEYDVYRKEYNDMVLSNITGSSNSIIQERLITVSIAAKDIDEARSFFNRANTELTTHLSKLSSICAPLIQWKDYASCTASFGKVKRRCLD